MRRTIRGPMALERSPDEEADCSGSGDRSGACPLGAEEGVIEK